MSRSSTIALSLVGVLGLASLAEVSVSSLAREWFAHDAELRGVLAVQAAHDALEGQWQDPTALARTLSRLARDERILGLAACDEDGRMIAQTPTLPEGLRCAEAGTDHPRSHTRELDVGGVPRALHVAAHPVGTATAALGSVLVVHDLEWAVRRESSVARVVWAALLIVAALGGLAAVLDRRLARRGLLRELRAALGGDARPELQPLLRDVRALADALAAERRSERSAGPWDAERLRETLTDTLAGERVVIVANREPYIHERRGDGIEVLHPASGLVTALEPVMRACSGTWVAHGSGSADREVVDAHDHVAVPPDAPAYTLRRVWLTEAEERGYYYGLANEGLWPLCHVAHTRPIFRAADWEHYRQVNERFAKAVVEEVDGDDPIVLVQDYHFALAPRLIRERLPRATIITFWHIPWPNAERVAICPWREQLLQGLLGSSVIGFHTAQHVNNFVDAVDAYLEARIDREQRAIVQAGRRSLLRPYPISIAWPPPGLDAVPAVDVCRRRVRERLGLPLDVRLGVGVDRLDYTKGIEERLLAVDALLERQPSLRGRFTFVQLAAPSRGAIDAYRAFDARVEALVEQINTRWRPHGGAPALVLLRAHHEPSAVFEHYRAADVCYVSSLHDGMNLVAKEFVAARDDELGVLVLSEFTGAARELTEALVVNPYDVTTAADALHVALTMPPAEQRARMRAMRRLVAELNVYRWAGRMLTDAAELRRRERLSGGLTRVVGLDAARRVLGG